MYLQEIYLLINIITSSNFDILMNNIHNLEKFPSYPFKSCVYLCWLRVAELKIVTTNTDAIGPDVSPGTSAGLKPLKYLILYFTDIST